MPNNATRRRFLEVSAAGALAALAGCSEVQSMVGDTSRSAADTEQPEDAQSADDSLSGDERQVQRVGESIRPAVVSIDTEMGGSGGGGTGWFVDDDHVVTNSHVVDGASSVTCWTLDGESFDPEVVASTDHRSDPYHDVALLRTDFDAPETLSLGDESALQAGQTVVQVGHPFAIGNWVISKGEFVREQEHSDAILSTAPSMSGNSGSPLVTMDQAVVGLTTGGVPKERSTREPGEAPEPVEPEVYESYQDATYATHNEASVVSQYVDEWTAE